MACLTVSEMLDKNLDLEIVAKELFRYGEIVDDFHDEENIRRITVFVYLGRRWRVRKEKGVVMWVSSSVYFG